MIMKIISLLLCLAALPVPAQTFYDASGNPAYQAFVVCNAWTNAIVISFADENGNWPVVVIAQGQSFHGLTSYNGMNLWDYNTYLYVAQHFLGGFDYNAGGTGQPYADTLTGDGSTNGVFFMATFYPLDTGTTDGNGHELYNPGGNIYQGPGVLYQLNYSQVSSADNPWMKITTAEAWYWAGAGFGFGLVVYGFAWYRRITMAVVSDAG